MKGTQAFLLAEAGLAFVSAPFLDEPLLRAASLIVSAVSVYSAFYLKRRLWLYGVGYLMIWGAVALFTLGVHPLVRFAGWEGASVVAWVLIAFGRGNGQRSMDAAFIGFTVNRLGDAFWVASLLTPSWKWGFLLGGWVKAALFPLSFWLVQAMYAPIPVSALLHSALLVALGVYGPIQNPGWLKEMPLEGIQAVAEGVALASAVGAALSKVPKVTLAWTTSTHLALVVALWSTPSLAQNVLLSHAYLKAALFLLLGLAQTSLRWNHLLRLAWLLTTLLLALSSIPTSIIGLVAETLTAFTLGRLWNAYPTSPERSVSWLLLAPLLLTVMGLMSRLQTGFPWHIEGLLPVLGTAIGLRAPWPKKSYRMDQVFLSIFITLEQKWNDLAENARKIEYALVHVFDRLFRGLLRFMRFAARGESRFIDWGWRPVIGRLRYALASWVNPFFTREPNYQVALQWAFLLTLIIFALWRYFF